MHAKEFYPFPQKRYIWYNAILKDTSSFRDNLNYSNMKSKGGKCGKILK